MFGAAMASSTETASLRTFGGLPFTLVALHRADGHLCNVLTHISCGDWHAIEQAIDVILHPRASPRDLSKVTRNILELIYDALAVTGPVMQSFFFPAIGRIAGKSEMARLEKKVKRLRRRVSGGGGRPPADARPRAKSAHLATAPLVRAVRRSAGAEIAERSNGARS